MRLIRGVLCAAFCSVGGLCALYGTFFALYQPIFILGALSGVLMLTGGAVSARNPTTGRQIIVAGLLGLFPLFYDFVISIVPEHARISSPVDLLWIATYLGLVALALFLPRPFRFSPIIFVTLIAAVGSIIAVTYHKRLSEGEYDRPTLECYKWDATFSGDLVLVDYFGSSSQKEELTTLLQNADVHGTVTSLGSGDFSPKGNRLIVVAQTKPPLDSKLFFPKSGSLLYLFDGAAWRKFPPDLPTCSLYASFKAYGAQAMICRTRPDGGEVCFSGF